MIDLSATFVVGSLAIDLVEVLNLVEINFFLCPVGGTQLVAAFKEHMLQIVGQTCGLLGVVLRTSAYSNVSLDTRCILVYAHEDLQAVVESVLTHLQRVVRISLVGIGFLCRNRCRIKKHNGDKT